jgi:hypothetical protein
MDKADEPPGETAMKRIVTALALFCMIFALSAAASAAPLAEHVPDARQVGSGKLNFLVWNVYTATLYAPSGRWSPDGPFALRIDYHMDLAGRDIAQRSVEEMRRQGLEDPRAVGRFRARMEDIFPDVAAGTSLTGIRDSRGATLFFRDHEFIGSVEEPEFTDRFFAIWLAPGTSEPALRRSLLGLQRP